MNVTEIKNRNSLIFFWKEFTLAVEGCQKKILEFLLLCKEPKNL